MKGAGGRTHGSAYKACCNACPDSVAAYNGTESGGKGHAVDISLVGQRPGQISVMDKTKIHGEKIKSLVAYKDWPDIFGMLSHGGKCQGCNHHADSRPCKADALGKEYGQVNVQKEHRPITADIDEAKGHSVFFGKIAGMARVPHKAVIALQAFSVEKVSGCKAGRKKNQEKYIAVQAVGAVEGFINGIQAGCRSERGNAHGPV